MTTFEELKIEITESLEKSTEDLVINMMSLYRFYRNLYLTWVKLFDFMTETGETNIPEFNEIQTLANEIKDKIGGLAYDALLVAFEKDFRDDLKEALKPLKESQGLSELAKGLKYFRERLENEETSWFNKLR